MITAIDVLKYGGGARLMSTNLRIEDARSQSVPCLLSLG